VEARAPRVMEWGMSGQQRRPTLKCRTCSRAAVGPAVDYGEAVALPEPRVANRRLAGWEVAELRLEVGGGGNVGT
jgi:hypothetical protein